MLDGEHVLEFLLGDVAGKARAVERISHIGLGPKGVVVVGVEDGKQGTHDAEQQERLHEALLRDWPRLEHPTSQIHGHPRFNLGLDILVGQVSDLLFVLGDVEQVALLAGVEDGVDRRRPLLLSVTLQRNQAAIEELPHRGLVVDGHVLAMGRNQGVMEDAGVHVVEDDLQLDALWVAVLEDVVERRVEPDHVAERLEVGQVRHDHVADHAAG
ncbi:hypothetical protein PGQ11_000126 [Apiospora arundinis]